MNLGSLWGQTVYGLSLILFGYGLVLNGFDPIPKFMIPLFDGIKTIDLLSSHLDAPPLTLIMAQLCSS